MFVTIFFDNRTLTIPWWCGKAVGRQERRLGIWGGQTRHLLIMMIMMMMIVTGIKGGGAGKKV